MPDERWQWEDMVTERGMNEGKGCLNLRQNTNFLWEIHGSSRKTAENGLREHLEGNIST